MLPCLVALSRHSLDSFILLLLSIFEYSYSAKKHLHEYDYVKEFGEGVDRLFLEMQKAGLTTPVYEVNSFMLNATISNIKNVGDNVGEKLNKREESILELICANPHITIEQLSVLSGVSTRTVERNIRSLKKKEYLERNGSDVKGQWIVKK